MNTFLLFSIVFFSIGIGWFLARRELSKQTASSSFIPQEYVKGLNYLLNDESDKALDIFIKALELNVDTVETHLTLGTACRKRGEFEKAVTIHQGLLDRPELTPEQKERVQMELAKDYMSAGWYDRAELLLHELLDAGSVFQKECLRHLASIFEKEKDWPSAIAVMEKMSEQDDAVNGVLSQYCCELAEEAKNKKEYSTARRNLKRALAYDQGCVRANLILGSLESDLERYSQAVSAFKSVQVQDSVFLTEALDGLEFCYKALNQPKQFVVYLKSCLEKAPNINVVLKLANCIHAYSGGKAGDKKASVLILEYLKRFPSVKGLDQLIHMNIGEANGRAEEHLTVLHGLTSQLLEKHSPYRCGSCGYHAQSLHWLCPSCDEWGAILPLEDAQIN